MESNKTFDESGQHWAVQTEDGSIMAFCGRSDGVNKPLFKAANSGPGLAEFTCDHHGRVIAEAENREVVRVRAEAVQ